MSQSKPDSRARFRQYVRRFTFALTLSDAQIAALDLIASVPAGSGFDWSSVNGLERRGLVEFIPTDANSDPWQKDATGRFKLTEAGRLVVALLIEADFLKRK